ncbi:hypothetical protein [Streptomyces antnestii]|uniref:hypothetical protein n=1 Tax=Streptomyces antnestii TaxID=2494256 RepID=UPI001CB8D996|nr:hypothetical protein [Streptomyces sp. San01]
MWNGDHPRAGHLTPGGRAMFRLMGCRYGDHRDWQAIDAWADGIAEDLRRGTLAEPC